MTAPLIIAKTNDPKEPVFLPLLPEMANRHGLITGATGTGKTVTLQKLAEQFSNIGVPVFLADVKGDLAGAAAAGTLDGKVKQRVDLLKLSDYAPHANPVVFWDVFGEKGHPLRATISDMGPLMFARLLNLNDVQAGVLQIVFKVADDNGLLLLDLKDLRSMVQYVGDNPRDFTTSYGNVSAASVGAIQRGLLTLDQQGGGKFFGEPMLDINDLIQTDAKGKGVVNILAADILFNSPLLYSTLLLWIMAELFEQMPEVGDLQKPKLVFFFDEAHLLFADAPPALQQKIEQVVRLIRSKGVGIYFVTQNPLDVPDTILSQLGNRVQHALRAFSPRDQKAVKVAADTLRQNPKFSAEDAIMQLEVGEALISFLDENGAPNMVERAYVMPPESRIGSITSFDRQKLIQASLLYGHYEKAIDRESAFEKLKAGLKPHAPGDATAASTASTVIVAPTTGSTPATTTPAAPEEHGPSIWERMSDTFSGGGKRMGVVETAAKGVVRSASSELGRTIMRGILGSIFGGRKR